MNHRHLHISDASLPATFPASFLHRVRTSSSTTLQEAFREWGTSPKRDLGLSFDRRIGMLRHLLRRFDEDLRALDHELRDRQADAIRFAKDGYAFQLNDRSLFSELLLDVDSFLVELRAALESAEHFILGVLEHVLGLPYTAKSFRAELQRENAPTDWLDALWKSPDLAVHQTSFSPAVRIQNEDPFEWALIVQRGFPRDVSEITDPVDLTWFRSVYDKFSTMLSVVEAWLITKVELHEQEEASG